VKKTRLKVERDEKPQSAAMSDSESLVPVFIKWVERSSRTRVRQSDGVSLISFLTNAENRKEKDPLFRRDLSAAASFDSGVL